MKHGYPPPPSQDYKSNRHVFAGPQSTGLRPRSQKKGQIIQLVSGKKTHKKQKTNKKSTRFLTIPTHGKNRSDVRAAKASKTGEYKGEKLDLIPYQKLCKDNFT